MDWASKELVGLMYHLLPGFLAAWVFYGLTTHPKPDPFERVVQALIFTIIVQALATVLRALVPPLATPWSRGVSPEDWALVWSVLIAVLVGVAFAGAANTDCPYRLLRQIKLTTKTSYASEWYGVFRNHERWITLHLKDGRRLYGWPEEWPDLPNEGHILLDQPQWLLDATDSSDPLRSSDRQALPTVAKTLVRAEDVEMIEFSKWDDELAQPGVTPTHEQRPNPLRQEKSHGTQDTSNAPSTPPDP